MPDLERALASLPVYRTYVEPWSGRVDDADRAALAALPDGFARVLLLEERGHDEFVTRFQQTSGAVMAKGVEDTAFYRYVRLLALNEVGGDPGRFGLAVEAVPRARTPSARALPADAARRARRTTRSAAPTSARGSARSPAWPERWASTCCAGTS